MADRGGADAAALRVAEQYVSAFGQVAKSGTTVLLPAALGDPAAMVAQALAIYRSVGSRRCASRPFFLGYLPACWSMPCMAAFCIKQSYGRSVQCMFFWCHACAPTNLWENLLCACSGAGEGAQAQSSSSALPAPVSGPSSSSPGTAQQPQPGSKQGSKDAGGSAGARTAAPGNQLAGPASGSLPMFSLQRH